MSKFPEGKGIYLWQIKRVVAHHGSNEAAVSYLKDNGFSWVAVKATDGNVLYNLTRYNDGWIDNILSPFIDAMVDSGIKVWLWGYNYGYLPKQEANVINRRLSQFEGLVEGFIFDPESQFKNKIDQAHTLINAIKLVHPNVVLGYSTFRYPTYHREFPWKPFMTLCDFHAPQVYWQDSSNPGYQLRKSVREIRAWEKGFGLQDKPIIPAGAAYAEHGWIVHPSEIVKFHETVRELDLQAEFFWEWAEAQDVNLMDDVSALIWDNDEDIDTTDSALIEMNKWADLVSELFKRMGSVFDERPR